MMCVQVFNVAMFPETEGVNNGATPHPSVANCRNQTEASQVASSSSNPPQ
jgi:hypothetical protein